MVEYKFRNSPTYNMFGKQDGTGKDEGGRRLGPDGKGPCNGDEIPSDIRRGRGPCGNGLGRGRGSRGSGRGRGGRGRGQRKNSILEDLF